MVAITKGRPSNERRDAPLRRRPPDFGRDYECGGGSDTEQVNGKSSIDDHLTMRDV